MHGNFLCSTLPRLLHSTSLAIIIFPLLLPSALLFVLYCIFLSLLFIEFLMCLVIAIPSSVRPFILRMPFTSVQAFPFFSSGLLFINRPFLPAIFPFAFPQFSLFPFLPPPSLPFARQACNPPLPMTHSLVCTGHVQHQKVCRGRPLSLRSVQQANWGYYKARNATTSETVAGVAAGDPPHRPPLPPAYNYVFRGHGKGRGERGRVVRGLAERGN